MILGVDGIEMLASTTWRGSIEEALPLTDRHTHIECTLLKTFS